MLSIHLDRRAIAVRCMSRQTQDAIAVELTGRACARAREGKWWMAAKNLFRLVVVATMATGCATSYRPTDTGPSAFAFTLTPDQCEHLRSEARAYRATEKTGEYVGTSTALVGAALLLIPATRNATTAQGATALVGLLAGGTSVFTASQVTDLEAEIHEGGCR